MTATTDAARNVHDLTKERLAAGVTPEAIAGAASVTVQAVKDCADGNGAPEANRRIYGYLTAGIVPSKARQPDEPTAKAARLVRAGDRLVQAVSHAFVHLPERTAGHTHVLNSADLCCRMTSEDDLAVDRDAVERAVKAWYEARKAIG